jgi:hypothetical protein
MCVLSDVTGGRSTLYAWHTSSTRRVAPFAECPNTNVIVDADEYQEQGSYTVFYKGDAEVFSMKTDAVETIRKR